MNYLHRTAVALRDLSRVVAACGNPMSDRTREHPVPGETVRAAGAEQRLRRKTLAARPPQDREIERLVDDHRIVAGTREMVERMAREGQSFHEPAKARAEVRPVLLDAERDLHQLHLA